MITGGPPPPPPEAPERPNLKARVLSNSLPLVEHYAGVPTASTRADDYVRYTFRCPGCGTNRLTLHLRNDAQPSGSGAIGCDVRTCAVPEQCDALAFSAHMEGINASREYREVLARALRVINSAPTGGEEERKIDPQANPENSPDQSKPKRLVQKTLSSRGAATKAGAGETQETLWAADDEPGSGKPKVEREQKPAKEEKDRPTAQAGVRDGVYTAMLGLAPQTTDAVVRHFRGLGLPEAYVRRAGWGHVPAGGGAGILAALLKTFGAATLTSVPGFGSGPSGHPTFELSSGGWALVPYRDAQGRILAVEAFDLAPSSGGSHRLLGGEGGARDPGLGGANHLWFPEGDPSAVEAVTDDLLEAMRAAAAGFPVAGLRGPESHSPGAGRKHMPEIEGLTYTNPQILYAPSPSSLRSIKAAPAAAATTIAAGGAAPLVLVRPPYDAGTSREAPGLGSYLLALPAKDRKPAFNRLCAAPCAAPLPTDAAAKGTKDSKVATRASRIRRGPPDGPADQLAKKPCLEATLKTSRAGDRRAARLAALAALAVLWPPLAILLGPLASVSHGITAAVALAGSSSTPPGGDVNTAVADPNASMLWLVGQALGPVAAWLEGPLAGLAAAGPAVASLLAGIAALVCASRVVAIRAKNRRLQVSMVTGDIK